MSKTKSIKGTRTEANLVAAYMSESAAYSRYTYYASQAEKEKYFPIKEIFTETAANELRHSKVYFKFLEGGNIPVTMGVDPKCILQPHVWPMKKVSVKSQNIFVR